MTKRSGASRKARPSNTRRYPRTARLNTLLQQVVASYLETVDDDRLGFLTVTGVEVDADLNRAQVFISSFDQSESDEVVLEALEEYRVAIQTQVANSTRMRKTPSIAFAFDAGVRQGARIEQILATIKDEEPGE